MSRTRRPAVLAALLLALCLAAPVAASAGRDGPRFPADAARVSASDDGWFRSVASAAWSWFASLFDEDNGSIAP